MKHKKEWETKSLEWIHKLREEIDREIMEKGITPAQWIKARDKPDVELLCQRLGLNNFTLVRSKAKAKV